MTERIQTELLPLECWPGRDLIELRNSIVVAVKRGRVQCHDLLVALDWLDAVEDELEYRSKQPTLWELLQR
jgi:hypothetical protein